jgi:hypothetical protein
MQIESSSETSEAMTHRCHWPGCEVEVEPKFWGCPPHWFSLHVRLRDRIWKHYRRGQEVTKDPSPEYLQAARDVRDWIIENQKMQRARGSKPVKKAK